MLSAKYFLDGDVFRPKCCDKPSFTWTRIAKAMNVLKEGFIWQVGNDNLIGIRWDHWGMEGLNGDSVCRSLLTNNERRVNDLWDQGQNRTWLHNPHSVYLSKSAYSWLSLKKIDYGPHKLFWRVIWKLKILPKIKVFSWRIDHNILPTYANIARVHHNFSTICPRCKNNEESLIHALKECLKGKDDPAMVVWERAEKLSNDFRPPTLVCKGWRKVDAAVLNRNVDYGAIARDVVGFVLAGSYVFENKATDVVWEKLKALALGLKLDSSLNLTKLLWSLTMLISSIQSKTALRMSLS
ncbi:hypothetical protein CXB51_034795 [Gossypium anomalum]|uniref:Reverse transcriptase zinc-binding domain-containing protein n=1 Tax=Gossypium anomalum TaxID=47600 RepID=A0A8J6CFA5_9ROSI|nr:hypothetical protein CXB51_034795 [Gossypium anomalum]